MSAVEVTITGMLYDKVARTTQNVVLVGEASLTGLSPGHPLPQPPGGGGEGIWGPTDPRPQPPIYFPPGGRPPGIWGPTDPRPEQPIYMPKPPTEPPEVPPGTPPNSVVKSADAGGWGYYTDDNSQMYSAYRPESGAGPKR